MECIAWMCAFVIAHFALLVIAQTSATTSPASLISSASASSSHSAQTLTVSVGIDHKFKPDVTQADVGDIIEFRFFPPNHSVVRAEYGYPCIPYEKTGRGKAGFFAGFHPVDAMLPDPPAWSVRINDTDPIFVYCSAPGSCINYAMVAVINPNATTSLQHQKDLARNSSYMLNPNEDFPPEGSSSASAGDATPSPSSTSKSTPTPSLTASSTPSLAPPPKAGLSPGAAAGIAVAGAAFVVLVSLLLFFVRKARKNKKKLKQIRRDITPDTPPIFQRNPYLRPKGGLISPTFRESAATCSQSVPDEQYEHRAPVGDLPEGRGHAAYNAPTDEAAHTGVGGGFGTAAAEREQWRENMGNGGLPKRHPTVTLNPHRPQEMDTVSKTPNNALGNLT